MSKEIATIKGATYVVTPTVDGTVSTAQGTIIATFAVGAQTSFVATGKLVIISDEQAAVDIYFNPAAPSVQGSGKMLTHLKDESLHLSPQERACLEEMTQEWLDNGSCPVPDGALTHELVRSHFAINAQPELTQAPSAVYVSRVPWARKEGTTWLNKASAVDETASGVPRKFMDNAGLQHECSTDSVEGVDDYNGHLWAFYWQHGNYMTDAHGIKHLTAIKGTPEFSSEQNVAAFGPAFWFFCCLERHYDAASGQWYTHDGTENGTPLFQLWGIASRAWADLDDGRRAELLAHGVTEADFHIWPECLVWDTQKEELVQRPYWIHSAYSGGAEKQADGSYKMVSKKNLPLFNNLSHNTFNALYGYAAGRGGGACANGFGMLFDMVKNATKDSKSIHKGCIDNYNNTVAATHDTLEAGYIWPVSSQGKFRVGCTVQLMQTSGDTWSMNYRLTTAIQQARIVAIETREFTVLDGTTASSLCLVFEPDTCQPFKVRVAAADAKALSDEGEYAHSYAVQGMALTGETDAVPYPHDGSMTSYTDGKHPYRVMGTEFLPGIWMIAADVVAIKGTGAVAVTIDGETTTPSTSEYVVLHAGFGVARKSSDSLQQYLQDGYKAVGIMPATAGWILNVQLTGEGVAHPTAIGGGDTLGHAAYMWASASPAQFLCGGDAYASYYAGSAHLNANCSLSYSQARFGGRD